MSDNKKLALPVTNDTNNVEGAKKTEEDKKPSRFEQYHNLAISKIETDQFHTRWRIRISWVFSSVLVILGGIVVHDSNTFINMYLEKLPKDAPIPNDVTIAYLSVSALKIGAIATAVSTFLFRGYTKHETSSEDSKP